MNDSKIIARIIGDLRDREAAGVAKYGTTVDRQDLTLPYWMRHFREELLDAVVYATRFLADLPPPPPPAEWVRIEDFRGAPGSHMMAWWYGRDGSDEGVVLSEVVLDEEGKVGGKGCIGADFYSHVMPANLEVPPPPKKEPSP